MSRPDKCIWCGLHDIRNIDGEVYFACGSSCYNISGVWEQSTGCAEILELRKRVAVAVAAAKQADRFDVIEWDGSTAVVREDDNQYAWATSLDELVAILEGKE